MMTAIYLSMFLLGGLACWSLSRVIDTRYWFVFIGIALFGYIVHGFMLDPAIGHPPWRDDEMSNTLADVDLYVRALSWFSFSLTIAGAIFGGLSLHRYRVNKSSNE